MYSYFQSQIRIYWFYVSKLKNKLNFDKYFPVVIANRVSKIKTYFYVNTYVKYYINEILIIIIWNNHYVTK